MANSAYPDQKPTDLDLCKGRTYLGSAGQGLKVNWIILWSVYVSDFVKYITMIIVLKTVILMAFSTFSENIDPRLLVNPYSAKQNL